MPRISRLLRETHRRAVWQVLGTYVAAAWVVLQVVEVLMGTVGLPEWVPRFALVLLLIGLPIMLATAIIQGAGRGRAAAARPEDGEAAKEVGAGDGNEAGRTPIAGSGTSSPRPAEGEPAAAPAPAPAGARSLFTWRNALFGGVGAFALLGVASGGWIAMRTLGIGPVGSLVATGVIEEGERIILADLAGDSTIATAATLALRVDLNESDIVSTVDPAFVSTVLDRMERAPDARLDAALAREVAIRAGIKAVVEGEITPLGGSHVLTVRLVAAETGEQLASFRETAKSSEGILDAIDRISRDLRERLGESLRSIHASEPLADVTTPSLEALQKYSQGWAAIDAGNDQAGVTLLEDAIALDSTFAMAWRKLATVTFGDRRIEAATKAYEHRDRLTDRERYHTLGVYHSYVTEDHAEAARAYRTLLETYPNDAVALNNLGVAYGNQDERALAAEMYGRAVAADPLVATYAQNLIFSLYSQGLTDSAGAALERYAENLPDHPELPTWTFRYATAERDYERAREALDLRLADSDLGRIRSARLGEAWMTLLHGRLSEAERIWDQLALDDPEETRLERALERAIELELRVLGDTAAAVRNGREALARHDIRELPIPQWPINDLLFLFAEAGRPELARPLALEWAEGMADVAPEDADMIRAAITGYLNAMGALHGDDPASGLPRLREVLDLLVSSNNCDSLCATSWLGTAFDLSGQADSAVVWYERYLTVTDLDRLAEDAQLLHRVYLRLGQLNDELGRVEAARRYYGLFETLWSDADPRLMPRVEAARARLAELLEAPASGS